MAIRLITHSGSDISPNEAKTLGIVSVPDLVFLGSRTYKNLTEISPKEFYSFMKNTSALPTTSHPSIGDFYTAFKEATNEGDEVFFLSVTSKMSGSYACACTARDKLLAEGCKMPITVYDTLECSHGMAILVREAVKLVKAGLSASELVAALDAFRSRVAVYFVLDTLKYAKAGGRVGAIKALAADVLGIKPLLSFDNGLVRDFGIARSMADGLEKVVKRFDTEGDKTAEVTVFHQDAKADADAFLYDLKRQYPNTPFRIEDVGPVIGVYTGPGGLGLAFTKL